MDINGGHFWVSTGFIIIHNMLSGCFQHMNGGNSVQQRWGYFARTNRVSISPLPKETPHPNFKSQNSRNTLNTLWMVAKPRNTLNGWNMLKHVETCWNPRNSGISRAVVNWCTISSPGTPCTISPHGPRSRPNKNHGIMRTTHDSRRACFFGGTVQ